MHIHAHTKHIYSTQETLVLTCERKQITHRLVPFVSQLTIPFLGGSKLLHTKRERYGSDIKRQNEWERGGGGHEKLDKINNQPIKEVTHTHTHTHAHIHTHTHTHTHTHSHTYTKNTYA